MSKLANVIGAKRLGNVLAKADAGAISGIMKQTRRLFKEMGISDYALRGWRRICRASIAHNA